MRATAWKGGTYGVRVGRANADKYFSKRIRTIEVQIGGVFYPFDLSDTFWTTCPEFRGAIIGDWLTRNGLAPWPRGKPPVLTVMPT